MFLFSDTRRSKKTGKLYHLFFSFCKKEKQAVCGCLAHRIPSPLKKAALGDCRGHAQFFQIDEQLGHRHLLTMQSILEFHLSLFKHHATYSCLGFHVIRGIPFTAALLCVAICKTQQKFIIQSIKIIYDLSNIA